MNKPNILDIDMEYILFDGNMSSFCPVLRAYRNTIDPKMQIRLTLYFFTCIYEKPEEVIIKTETMLRCILNRHLLSWRFKSLVSIYNQGVLKPRNNIDDYREIKKRGSHFSHTDTNILDTIVDEIVTLIGRM
jgi:hypothetical protein